MPPSNSENLLRTRLSPLREIARRILGRSADNPSDAQLQQVLNTNSPVRLPELPGSQLTFSPGEATVRAWPRAFSDMDIREANRYSQAWDPEYRSGMEPASLLEQTRLAVRPGDLPRIGALQTEHRGTLNPTQHSANVDDVGAHESANDRYRNHLVENRLISDHDYPSFGGYRAYNDVNVPYQVVGFEGLGPGEPMVQGHFPFGGPHHTRMSLITHGGRIGQANLDELQSDFFSAGARDPERSRELDAQIYALNEQKDALMHELREEGREGRSWREQSPRYHAITSEWQSVENEVRRLQAESDKAATGVADYGPLRSIWPRVLLNDAVLRAIDTPEANFFTWSPPSVHRSLYGIAEGAPEDNMYRNMYEKVVPRAAEQLHRRLGVPYRSATIPGDASRLNDEAMMGPISRFPQDPPNFQGFRITDELRRAAEGVNRLVDDPRLSGFSLPLYAEGGGVA